jgi:hypothetical protein
MGKLPSTPGRPPKLTPEQVQQLVEMVQAKRLTLKEIGFLFNVSEGTVRRYASAKGTKRRPRKSAWHSGYVRVYGGDGSVMTYSL